MPPEGQQLLVKPAAQSYKRMLSGD